jgi:hypothetical protein
MNDEKNTRGKSPIYTMKMTFNYKIRSKRPTWPVYMRKSNFTQNYPIKP